MKLRQNEEEAFIVYRNNLNRLIKDAKNWNGDQIKEAFLDTIRPEINKIDKSIKDWKRGKKQSLATTAAATVSAGVFLGYMPFGYTSIIAAMGAVGGISTAVKCTSDLLSLIQEPKVAYENDNYFLWKLSKNSK